MKPGRELDALVAEKVMGWKRVMAPPEPKGFPLQGAYHACDQWYDGDTRVACRECGDLPAYSTSISDAWEVVEKVEWQKFALFKHEVSKYTPEPYWTVVWQSCGEIQLHAVVDDCCAFAEAFTAPHAICLAALKAVGHEL